ncbi:MAG: glycosyltransferase [Bacteroidia bacterium]
MKSIHIGIVIPVFNESKNLLETCSSLGFGEKADQLKNTYLFLIDNGSTDDSVTIAENIRISSRPNSVFIGHEPERGYVPPRHKGVRMCKEFAFEKKINDSDFLVLQCDGDTYYEKGFLEKMLDGFAKYKKGVLFEGSVNYPDYFINQHKEFVDLCIETDNKLFSLFVDDNYDVIVDDKVCGYNLDDYWKWGGHTREFDDRGDEIHVGSTRLFLKSLYHNVKKVRIYDAVAKHSARKIILNPALQFAVAGFTQSTSWKRHWAKNYKGPKKIEQIIQTKKENGIEKLVSTRYKHLLTIFCILPLHSFNVLDQDIQYPNQNFKEFILSILPKRDREDLRNNPGTFINDSFRAIERYGDAILEKALSYSK